MQDTCCLDMQGIRKRFDSIEVLHGVDFSLSKGEVMALMGENGAGKSTLMKVLTGAYDDWTGEIGLDGKPVRFRDPGDAARSGVVMIHQELQLVPELTVAQNIGLGREPGSFGFVSDSRLNEDAERIMESLHFPHPVNTPVGRLRVGHRQLVEIGKALSCAARILVMDEPTSALSEPEIRILHGIIRRLRKEGVSVVYITHRLAEVADVADRITVLRDGKTVAVRKAADMSREDLIRMMVGRPTDRFFVKENVPGQEVLMRVRNLCRRRPGRKDWISDVSLELHEGEMLGVAGLLGSGRTELLEALFGADPNHVEGSLEIQGRSFLPASPIEAIDAGLALLTEDRKGSGLVETLSVGRNMTLANLRKLAAWGLIPLRREEESAESYRKRMDIKQPLSLPVTALSGGNQQKVVIAKWLATRPRILLLDEPTRGIDVGSKHEIYRLLSELASAGMGILMTSSELPELLALCDRILVLREGVLSAEFTRKDATQEKILDAAAPGQ